MDLGHQYEKVILGSSYCSGFVDSAGRWNSGFYCPETEETSISVFCCGSQSDKYCCTKADQRIKEDGESNMVTLILITLFIILLVITTISCIFFSTIHSPWWTRSRKFLDKWQLTRHVARDTCDSISGENVLGSTSCDPFLPTRDLTCPTQVLLGPLDNDLAHFKNQEDSLDTISRRQAGHPPPPPYNILPIGSYIIVPQDTPDLICESQAPVDPSFLTVDNVDQDFFSTKF